MSNPYNPPSIENSYFGVAQGGAMMANRGGGGGAVDDSAVEMLRQTKPWVMFLSVMMFIGSGLMLIAALFMMVAGAAMSSAARTPFSPMLMGVIYLPMAAIYIYPATKLWAYGSSIGRLVMSRQSSDLTAALSEQKSFWKFLGIMTLALMALYFLVFLGAIVAGVALSKHSY